MLTIVEAGAIIILLIGIAAAVLAFLYAVTIHVIAAPLGATSILILVMCWMLIKKVWP